VKGNSSKQDKSKRVSDLKTIKSLQHLSERELLAASDSIERLSTLLFSLYKNSEINLNDKRDKKIR
jgi:hypothetical protein